MKNQKKLYLVSGFLGTGKTTLMKRLITLFSDSDRRIAVIVNEFGQQGVDGILLSESGIKVDEINNGSVFCVCRSDLFVEALIKAVNSDAEIVLVETSGLSDPTGMERILNIVTELSYEDTLAKGTYDFCGTIAVVESARFLKLYQNVVAIKQQIISAGLILINKIDISDKKSVDEAEEIIASLNPFAKIYHVSYGEIKSEWLDELKTAQQKITGGITKNTLGVMKMLIQIHAHAHEKLDFDIFKEWLDSIAPDVYRIKGFADFESGRCEIECVGENIQIIPTEISGESYLVLLAPANDRLRKKITETCKNAFHEKVSFS